MSLFSDKRTIFVAPQSILLTIFILLTLYFLFYIKDILLLMLLAFIIMVALRPVVMWFRNRLKFQKFLAIVATYIIFLAGLLVFLLFVLPPLAKEVIEFISSVDLPAIENEIKTFEFSLSQLNDYADRIGQSVNMVFNVINATFSTVFKLLTIFVISVYLMIDRDNLYKKIGWFTNKPKHFRQAKGFIDSIELQLGGWVRGQVILMLAVGLFTYIGLMLLGIPRALPLALIAGLLEIVPNIGPTVSAIPAIIIAYLAFGPVMALVVLLLFVVIQQVENNLLVPKVMSAQANVNPLISILSILIGLKLVGVLGALLAVPSYIILRTTYVTFFNLVDKKDIEKIEKA